MTNFTSYHPGFSCFMSSHRPQFSPQHTPCVVSPQTPAPISSHCLGMWPSLTDTAFTNRSLPRHNQVPSNEAQLEPSDTPLLGIEATCVSRMLPLAPPQRHIGEVITTGSSYLGLGRYFPFRNQATKLPGSGCSCPGSCYDHDEDLRKDPT